MAIHGGVSVAADEKAVEPCTVATSSGAFYDLRKLSVILPADGKKPGKNDKTEDYHAKGYDYPANFTLNICAPIVADIDRPNGIDRKVVQNVSAFYEIGSKTYSIGQQSSNLTVRGRRLVLQYEDGSPCGESSKRDHDDDDDDSHIRRKSTLISFHCDKDPLATAPSVTFVGASPDECSYHFEVLSKSACIGSEPTKQGVGPGAVFAIIGVIAILVYFLGGVFYQRNVAHARGWRQLPNYSMWAGIGSFVKVGDFFGVRRVMGVRDSSGYLPTMDVKPNKHRASRSYLGSRNSWESSHLS